MLLMSRIVCIGIILFFFFLSNVSASKSISESDSKAIAEEIERLKSYALSKMVERCDVILQGQVIGMERVWRDELKHAPSCTTDVTVGIDELIKGTPNAGKNKIKLMTEGGRCVHPETGEWWRVTMNPNVRFEFDEQVFLFLYECESVYCADFPHNALQTYLHNYGKRTLKWKPASHLTPPLVMPNVYFIYVLDDSDTSSLAEVDLPLDLTIDMCKAAVKDMDAVVELEEDIKAALVQTGKSRLPESLITRLKRDVKAILDKKN